ncbi:hypothetical protein J3A83DRAFT_4370141 [Scleroderma citrinum]
MARYPFPSTQSHSPYHGYAYPPPTTPSAHSHYSTPRRHSHSTPYSPYTPNTQNYLAVPATTSSHHSRNRSSHGHTHTPHHHSRTHSQSRSHHGHGANTSNVIYTPSTAYSHLDTPNYHTHRYPSSAHSHHSHHSHAHSHASSHHYPTHRRTNSISDRVRRFFGLDPSPHLHPHPVDSGRRRHNSFSSHRDDTRLRRSSTRTGPWFFGSTDHRRYVDDYGREVDHHGRIIHRF